jgi:hypothetical protein
VPTNDALDIGQPDPRALEFLFASPLARCRELRQRPDFVRAEDNVRCPVCATQRGDL